MPSYSIDSDGTVYIDGKPVLNAKQVPVIEKDVKQVIATIKSGQFSVKSLEKLLAWGAALVASTNGFAQAGLPSNIREWMLGGAALILAGIHNNTPDA